MRCSSCQHENRTDARFCDHCGQRLGVTCAACGVSNSPDRSSCDHCGAPLSGGAWPRVYTPPHLAEKILTTRSALEGERKQVTVLFCDIANSTALTQRLGAEAMHDLLNRFFELALEEVHGLEGTINSFLGDGFMALFGAPVAHEDHVRRALLAALGIRQKLKENEASGTNALGHVHVRMGLNSGMVVVGKIGDNLRMDYTAIGDTTNIAARLMQLAQPDHIHASESVFAAGSPYFDFTSAGEHLVKGIAEPIAVYELIRARAREESGSPVNSPGISSPLVGRDPELALLQEQLDALERGKGGILIVTGDAGAGKSRLVAEVHRRARPGNTLWLEGRAVSFGRSLSYLPFIEILKGSFNIKDDDTETENWRKLEQGLAALFAERASEMLPYLATVLALRVPPEHEDRLKFLDGPSLRRQVFLCMRQLFERLARRQPVVLLLEDWHWADQSSVELAEHLLPLTNVVPLLVFVLTRPEPAGPSGRLRRFVSEHPEGRFQEIKLNPLAEEQSAILIGNLVGALDLPEALREQILRKTDGNPFFIEEVIRSLVGAGVMVREAHEQAWQLAKPVDQLILPDTIQGLILARIDRLDEEVKQVLKLASVIGRNFFYRVLGAISDAQNELDSNLEDLERAELVRRRQPLPELEYIFKHALVQEAAYESILVERRRAIHRRVAQAVEAIFADRLEEFASLLAYHYTRAEDWGKAHEYLFKAGEQAGRMAADTEALDHFRQAETAYLKAFGDQLKPLERASLARKIGAALYGTGHYEQSLEQFRRALSQLGLHYPTTRWGIRRAIVRHLASHWIRRLRRDAGVPAVRDMDSATAQEISTICHFMSWSDYFLDKERMLLDCLLELYAGERSTYAVAEARGLSSVGFGFMTFNARRRARKYHTEACEIAERTHNGSAIAFAWFALGFLDFYDGRWDECDENLGKGAAVYRETGDVHRWGGAMLMRFFVVYFRGGLRQSAALAAELERAGDDAGDPQLTSWGYMIRGYTDFACGPLDEAVAILRKGLALTARIPAWDTYLYMGGVLAKCLVLQGKLDEATEVLGEALQTMKVEKFSKPFDQVEIRSALATCKVAIVECREGSARIAAVREARRACKGALRCARVIPGWLPEALRLYGTLAWLEGDQGAAERRWEESVEVAAKSSFPVERARTWLEMGRRTGDAALVERAIGIFTETGAKTFLASARHALAQLHARPGNELASTIQSYTEAVAALEDSCVEHELELARAALGRLQESPGHTAGTRAH